MRDIEKHKTKELEQRIFIKGVAYRHLLSNRVLVFEAYDPTTEMITFKSLKDEEFVFDLLSFYLDFELHQDQLHLL